MKPGNLRNTMLAAGVAGLAAAASTASAAGAPGVTSSAINFQTPSKSVFCGIVLRIPGTAFDPGVSAQLKGEWPGLQCSAAGIGPKHPTEGDPFVQIGQGKTGRARLVEIGDDDLASQRAPVTLKAGSTWHRDGISCTIATASATCRNSSGHGFTVSTGHLKTH